MLNLQYDITTRKLTLTQSSPLTQISSTLFVFVCLCGCVYFYAQKLHIFFFDSVFSQKDIGPHVCFCFWNGRYRFQPQKSESTLECAVSYDTVKMFHTIPERAISKCRKQTTVWVFFLSQSFISKFYMLKGQASLSSSVPLLSPLLLSPYFLSVCF